MRGLRSCDFCDGDAAGTFEAVPAELEPAEDERRRVVLCRDCKGRLETVLEPLLARLGVDDDETAAGSTANEDAGASTAGSEPASTGDSRTGITFEREAGAAAEDEPAGKREGADDPGAGEAEQTGIMTPESEEAGSGESDDAGSDSDPAPEPSTRDERATGSDSSARTESETAVDADSSGDDGRLRAPQTYAKTIRLLRNREFPMERTAVEELAAGAYDLETREAEAIVDHALERDEFSERGGTLYRS
ncbi:hypothetical protein EA462_01720 [Natrarchaeobius halalkaliphilus]|uniref:Uncharacterized protein n=1 Tax=Natrarchaeobius halalkaliphilus TaxID=1679091 RepID=A0A3N6M9K1_9EURY|nr:hypothetical protein [Natrarchaeobius halalkaliphilus]RQG92960.1 hypothetical protein EA462_01720 [Natrarchaeobius halalkaliphilus]